MTEVPTQTLVAAEEDTSLPWSRKELDPKNRFFAFLGSPRAVMILVPLLVLALGAALTIVGQGALTITSKKMARDRFVSHTSSVSLRLESTLGQAEPLLDELSRIAKSHAPLHDVDSILLRKRLALEFSSLLVGRPGITQAYIAYPGGAFVSANYQDNETARFQVVEDKVSTSYRVHERKLHETSKEASQYDPSQRQWYRLATESKNRSWTEPYAFYTSHHAGITQSLPIYLDTEKTRLLAVVGVDFDVDTLTAFMAAGESNSDDLSSVVFTLEGVVLAYPKGAEKLARLPRQENIPTHEALGDAALSALIEHVQGFEEKDLVNRTFDYRQGKNNISAAIRKVGGSGPDFYVATFSPQKEVLAELYSHRKSSLLVGSLALLIALSLSWFLARRLLQVRRVANIAQEAAQEAQAHMRDLGSYRLVSMIGEGGMGEVWHARHHLLAREAAIKLIKQGPHSAERQEENRERFRREARAIAKLRSRNTVALFDYGVTKDGTLFYVMELLDGIDLSTLVSDHGPQPAERVRKILLQACNSLIEAHEAHLVHRDIKPANLFLCREAEEMDVVKVLDFGIVFEKAGAAEGSAPLKFIDTQDTTVDLGGQHPSMTPSDDSGQRSIVHDSRITHAERQLGTPAFMSPEQAIGSDTDGRSDLYSLACVAWWLLSGEPLFVAESPLALMVKHINEDLPDFEGKLKTPAPAVFLDLIRKCLEKDPKNRPQSARELRKILRKMGPLEPSWTEEDALNWWAAKMPRSGVFSPKTSAPPLRDVVVMPPPVAL